MATLVKFLKEGKDILAIFPQHKEFNGYRRDNLSCYSHIGQHSVAAPEYIKRLNEASKKEYADLQTELESIGYTLKVLNHS